MLPISCSIEKSDCSFSFLHDTLVSIKDSKQTPLQEKNRTAFYTVNCTDLYF
jgi:hypothetical protein